MDDILGKDVCILTDEYKYRTGTITATNTDTSNKKYFV